MTSIPADQPEALPAAPLSPPADASGRSLRRIELILAVVMSVVMLIELVDSVISHFNSDIATMIFMGVEAIEQGTFLLRDYKFGHEWHLPVCLPGFWQGLLYYWTGWPMFSCLAVFVMQIVLLFAALAYAMRAANVPVRYSLLFGALFFPMFYLWIYYSLHITWMLLAVGYYVRVMEGNKGRFERAFTFVFPVVALLYGLYSLRQTLWFFLPMAFYHALVVFRAAPRRDTLNPFRWIDRRPMVKAPFIWLAANAAGVGLFRLWEPVKLIDAMTPTGKIAFRPIMDIPRTLGEVVSAWMRLMGIRELGSINILSIQGCRVVLFLALTIFMLLRFGKEAGVSESRRRLLYSLGMCVLCLAAYYILLVPQKGGGVEYRYLLPLILPMCALGGLVLESIRREGMNRSLLLLFMTLTFVVGVASRHPDPKLVWRNFTAPPLKVRAERIADFLERQGLSRGYATYWHAHSIAYMLPGRVKIGGLTSYALDKTPFRPGPLLSSYRNYSRAFAEKNVFLMLTNAQHEAALKNPENVAILEHGQRLDAPADLGYVFYVFREANPFILDEDIGKDFSEPGGEVIFFPAGIRGVWTGYASKAQGGTETEGGSLTFPPGPKRGKYGPHKDLPPGKYRVEVNYAYLEPPATGKPSVGFHIFSIKDGKRHLHIHKRLPVDATTEIFDLTILPEFTSMFELCFSLYDDTTPFRIDNVRLVRVE